MALHAMASSLSTEEQIVKGLGQTMYTDSILHIGGVSYIMTFVHKNPRVASNVGDTIQILNTNTFEVLYEKILNDTIFCDTSYYTNGIYNIIFDSAVVVEGDYMITYKYNSANIIRQAATSQYPEGTYMWVYYNMPISCIQTAYGICYNTETHHTDTNDYFRRCDYLRINRNPNYQKQVYCYNNQEDGWRLYTDFCTSHGFPVENLRVIDDVASSDFGNVKAVRPQVPHTTDLALFVIPEYAVDSADRARAIASSNAFVSSIDDAKVYAKVSISPNPTKDVLRVVSDNRISIAEFYNMQGVRLETKEINANETILSIAEYPKGVYLLKVHTDKGITTKKVIKN